jgi:hypothetical protein
LISSELIELKVRGKELFEQMENVKIENWEYLQDAKIKILSLDFFSF